MCVGTVFVYGNTSLQQVDCCEWMSGYGLLQASIYMYVVMYVGACPICYTVGKMVTHVGLCRHSSMRVCLVLLFCAVEIVQREELSFCLSHL